jgi:hypothetical protein
MNLIKTTNIKETVAEITTAVQNGEVNALEAFISLKKIEEIIKQVKKNVDDLVIEEAAKYNTKTFTTFDAEVTLKNSATRYDYSNIPEIVNKELELKALKDKHKAALKSNVIDFDTGELVEAPIVKGGKEVVSIKLNK